MKNFLKVNSAFTLAEILVALTIIGVVAALTIPNVMINTNASHARTAIKKGIASINQAILTSAAEDGYDCAETIGTGEQSLYNIITKRMGGKLLTANSTTDNRWKIYANFIANPADISQDGTKTGVPTLADSENELMEASDYTVNYYMLPDGMALILPPNLSSCGNPRLLNSSGVPTSFSVNGNTACIGFLDINGAKGPNQVIGCESKPTDISTASATGEYIISDPGDPKTCEVKEKSITDVYPIVFYNDKAYPATYAAMTVFMDAQKDD